MKNSSYYIAPVRAPVGDRTHDLPHTVASNMVKVSHALKHSATEGTLVSVAMVKIVETTWLIEDGNGLYRLVTVLNII